MPLLHAAAGAQRRRLRGATTARSAPTSARSTTSATWPPPCATAASACASTWCSTTSPASTPGRQAARAGDAGIPRLLPRLPRPRPCPTRTSATLPEVFPDFAPGNFTWDDDLGGWVWTTFNAYQWDLNWANPEVFCEFADIILWLANLGVEVFRLDAIAFLWKRIGTTCQNQPEVHDAHPGAARGRPDRRAGGDVQGRGDRRAGATCLRTSAPGAHAGKVSDLAYHNSLMVQIWSMLASGDARLAARALQRAPADAADHRAGSPTCAATTTSAGRSTTPTPAAVGSTGYAHRRFLSDWYAGAFPGS